MSWSLGIMFVQDIYDVCLFCVQVFFLAFEMKFDMLWFSPNYHKVNACMEHPCSKACWKEICIATHIPRPPKCGKNSILNLSQNYKRGHNICLNFFVIRSKDYPSVVWNVVCPWAPKDMSNGQGITCWKKVLKYSSFSTFFSTFNYGILVACSSLPSSLALLYGSYMYMFTCDAHITSWC